MNYRNLHIKAGTYLCHEKGYSDLVVMSSEFYERLVQSNKIDQAIYEVEKEITEGAELIALKDAMEGLNKKYYG